jgi:hypothetical protein
MKIHPPVELLGVLPHPTAACQSLSIVPLLAHRPIADRPKVSSLELKEAKR